MTPVAFLYLSQQEVIDAGFTLKEAIDIVEDVFKEHGLKKFENPPKPGVHPRDDAFIHAMPGYLPRKGAVGLKWVSGYPSNPQHGLPLIMGLIVLNDVNTGQPIAVMDCAYITALRTAAASGVAAKYLANQNAKVIGIVGAGVQGRYNLLALNEVLPGIQVARVFDTNESALQQFVKSMSKVVPFPVEAAQTAAEVIQGADIVVTATGKLDKPVFKEKWVTEGALVLPVHTAGWEPRTLHQVDKFIVDDWQQFSRTLGQPGGFYMPLPDLYAELGEIVTHKKPGRESKSERIINFNFGIAIHDVAVASVVFARAKEKGIGTKLNLTDGELPLSS